MNVVKLKSLGYNNKVSADFRDFYLYSDIEKLSQDFNNVKTTSSLNNGDVVFIPSWVEFPRYKLREYGAIHNISITRDPAKADVIVIDKEVGNNLVYSNATWLRYNTTIHNGETLREYSYTRTGTHIDTSSVNNTFVEGIEKILNYPTKRFINIGDLSKLTNTQGIILTERHYESLKRMFTSANSEDVELAMEQLANCNFNESLVKLWILYGLNKTVCDRTRFAKSVNFSNLMNYFRSMKLNPSNYYSNFNFSNIIKSLFDAQIETSVEDLDILREGLQQEIEDSISGYNESDKGFKIHNFDVEFLLKIKQPVVEQIKTGLEFV